jgi:hypothetical protein
VLASLLHDNWGWLHTDLGLVDAMHQDGAVKIGPASTATNQVRQAINSMASNLQ